MKGGSCGLTWHHIQEDRSFHCHPNENLKSQILKFSNKRDAMLTFNRKVQILLNHKYILIQSNDVMVLGVTPRKAECQIICF